MTNEHILKKDWNDTWYLNYLDADTFFNTYNRPVYTDTLEV